MIRHEIDQALIQKSVIEKIMSLEKKRAELEQYPKMVVAYDRLIERERERYSKAYVLEVNAEFVLMYDSIDPALLALQRGIVSASGLGTGPFNSLQEAIDWFKNGGR